MKWDSQDEKDNPIVSASNWFALPFYKKTVEARAGVYIFADKSHDVKYIGKAGAGRLVVEMDKAVQPAARLIYEIYSAIGRKKDQGASLVKVLYTNSDEVALKLEKELIDKYEPDNNGVDLLTS